MGIKTKVKTKVKTRDGVNKDPSLRVKVPRLPAPVEIKPRRLSKVGQKKQLVSIFGDNAEKILQLLDTNDTDSAVSLIYKKALSSIVDLLPYAEHAVRKSEGAKGVYAFNSLVSALRELMSDIQASQDRGMLGAALVDKVIRPAYSDLATEIVREYAIIATDVKQILPEKHHAEFVSSLKESRARLAEAVSKQYRRVNQDAQDFLR